MKVLIIAYHFPPILGAQSIRWANLTNELCKLGISIDILTVKVPVSYNNYPFKFEKDIKVYRAYPGVIEGLFFKASSHMKVITGGKHFIKTSAIYLFGKKAALLVRKILDTLLLHDLRIEWFPFALHFIKKHLNINEYDVVVTSHEPGVDSLLGLYLKHKYKIRWIADFGDPFVASYTPKWRKPIDVWIEKVIYTYANIIILTNKTVQNSIVQRYNIEPKKIYIVPQGFDYELTKKYGLSRYKNNDKFVITYTGTFYKEFRNPSELINAIYELSELPIKLIIVGQNELMVDMFQPIKDKIIFIPSVSHEQAIEYQLNCDTLLHMTNKYKEQIPGKIYEYLGAAKPVLCVTYNSDDESAMLISQLKRGIIVENNKTDIKRAIKTLYELWSAHKLNENFDLTIENCYQYSWQYHAKTLYSILQDLLRG